MVKPVVSLVQRNVYTRNAFLVDEYLAAESSKTLPDVYARLEVSLFMNQGDMLCDIMLKWTRESWHFLRKTTQEALDMWHHNLMFQYGRCGKSFDKTKNIHSMRLRSKGKHTSNLKAHLAVKHTTEFNIVSELNKTNPKLHKPKTNEDCTALKKLKYLCMKLIAIHGRPLAMIDDDAFQELLKLAAGSNTDVSHINIKTVKAMITEQAYNIRHKIGAEIINRLIIIKVDSATCMEKRFIGINIQYIQNAQTVVRNLAVLEVNQSQTGTFLKECLEEVLVEFKISKDQIYCVCTDNGANMIKLIGGKYYIEEEESEEENVGLLREENVGPIKEDSEEENVGPVKEDSEEEDVGPVIEDSEEENVGAIKEESLEVDIANEWAVDELAEIDNEKNAEISEQEEPLNFNEIVENLSRQTEFKIRGMLCATHTLQLAVKDAIMSNINVQTTINLARTVVQILRKPTNFTKINQANLKKPIHDCPTRWTSTYEMLKRLLILKDICDTILELSLITTSEFWTEISILVQCLEPANAAMLELQRQHLTIGDFYISWLNCKNIMQEIDHSFAKSLVSAMQIRETKFLQNDVVLECLYLDRRLNVMLNEIQCEKAKNLLKETFNQLQKIKSDQANNYNSSENDQCKDMLPLPSTSRGMPALEEMLARAERSRGSFRHLSSFDTCLNELLGGSRLPLSENIIQAWNNATVVPSDVTVVANTVLAVPTSQVSVERLFSSLKFILHPLRSNLSEYFLRDLILIRENRDLLD